MGLPSWRHVSKTDIIIRLRSFIHPIFLDGLIWKRKGEKITQVNIQVTSNGVTHRKVYQSGLEKGVFGHLMSLGLLGLLHAFPQPKYTTYNLITF